MNDEIRENRRIFKSDKGITLLELIIVIAIMAVIVGVATPMFLSHLNKSRRSRDLVTAERIATASYVAFACNSDAFDAYEKWEGLSANVSATYNGVTETYKVYLVAANEDQYKSKKIPNCFHWTVALLGDEKGTKGFYGTINDELGLSRTSPNDGINPRFKIKRSGKIPGTSKNFSNVDVWRICKNAKTGQLEIWAADHNRYGGYPCYRLWPNPDDAYTKK